MNLKAKIEERIEAFSRQLVFIRKRLFSALAVSICGLACVAYLRVGVTHYKVFNCLSGKISEE